MNGNLAEKERFKMTTLKTLAIAAALAAVVIPAMPAAAATQCFPPAMMNADVGPLPGETRPPEPKCEFPAGKKNHERADFYLFDKKCAHKPNAILARLSAEFEQLPSDIRTEALDHEMKLIEAIPEYTVPGGWYTSPGGPPYFCANMNLWDAQYYEEAFGK
jgi:hypothetical protein